jgi:hypothetical protein
MTGITIAAALVAAFLGQAPKVNADAQVLSDFKARIDQYMKLHDRLEKKAPRLKSSEDPAKIKASQDTLAALIRAERAHARQGEIFTPQVGAVLRRLMNPELTGREGAQTKQTIKEDAPAPREVKIAVNASYPEDAPLPTVPPNLLASLPQLPEDLEYRVVRQDLILRDVHANIIVDFLPKVIR